MIKERDRIRTLWRYAQKDSEWKTRLNEQWMDLCARIDVSFGQDEKEMEETKLIAVQRTIERGDTAGAWRLINDIAGNGRKAAPKVKSSR